MLHQKLVFLIFIILPFSNYGQTAEFNPKDSTIIGKLYAPDGDVVLNLKRGQNADQAKIQFPIDVCESSVGACVSGFDTNWELGVFGTDEFKINYYNLNILGIPNEKTYEALTISFSDLTSKTRVRVLDELQLGTSGAVFSSGIFSTTHDGSFLPARDNSSLSNLGNSSKRWNQVWAANGTIQTSDGRLKKNIVTIERGLDAILKLRPVKYNWKSDQTSDQESGFIAQEVLKVLPDAVVTHEYVADESGNQILKEVKHLGMDYSKIIPVLVSAIQEQQQIIEELQKQLK